MARRYGRLPSEIARNDAADFTFDSICMMAGEAQDRTEIGNVGRKGGLMPVVIIGGGG